MISCKEMSTEEELKFLQGNSCIAKKGTEIAYMGGQKACNALHASDAPHLHCICYQYGTLENGMWASTDSGFCQGNRMGACALLQTCTCGSLYNPFIDMIEHR